MSSTAASLAAEVCPGERLEVLFEELAELAGQRNAIDGRIVEIVAEIDRDELWGATGARSVAALVAWKTGTSLGERHTIAAVAHRLEEFPRCAAGLREGRLSLDQVGVIAERAADGSDEHYARTGRSRHGQPAAHRGQARTPTRTRPPEPEPQPPHHARSPRPPTSEFTHLADHPAARRGRDFDAALESHRDALITDWKRDHDHGDRVVGAGAAVCRPPSMRS